MDGILFSLENKHPPASSGNSGNSLYSESKQKENFARHSKSLIADAEDSVERI